MFTWSNETEATRMRTKKESVKFPNSVTPKTHLKVGIVGGVNQPSFAKFSMLHYMADWEIQA